MFAGLGKRLEGNNMGAMRCWVEKVGTLKGHLFRCGVVGQGFGIPEWAFADQRGLSVLWHIWIFDP